MLFRGTLSRCLPVLFVGCVWSVVGCQQAPVDAPDVVSDVPPLPSRTPAIKVTVDGQPATPLLEYAGKTGGADQYVVNVGIALKLEAKSDLSFRWEEARDRLLVEPVGQRPRLVGVRVFSTYEDDQEVLVNPLASLNDADLRGLWGIEIDHWSDAIADQVGRIDPLRTCVTIREGAAVGGTKSLPPLPPELATLRIESRSSEGFEDFDELRKLTRLTSLSIRTMRSEPLDCSLLGSATRLETLDLRGNALKNTAALGSLTQLKILQLSYCDGLVDISFARSLRNLEVLEISRTQVADLAPLTDLARLRTVSANMSAVRKLPANMKSLRQLQVLASPVTEADVRAFQTSHPQCEVRHRWTASLLKALEPVTRLRIRSGGTCHRVEANEQTLFETDKGDEIKQLLAAIEINEEESGFHCMCCGDPSLEFYAGDRLLLTVGFHHGQGLRWPDGWPGDAALTPQSVDLLIGWLANRNVTGPREQREAEAKRASLAKRKFAQATEGLPPTVARSIDAGPKVFVAALQRELPEKGAQVRAWLRMLGASNDSWTQLGAMEQVADEQLRKYDTETLAAEVEAALLGNDRQTRRGAARFWSSWRSPLEAWRPNDAARLHSIVLQIQQEARYYPLRMSALDDLARWRDGLSEAEFDLRLDAGLHDPAPQVRRKAMLTAGKLGHAKCAGFLLSILRGETPMSRPLPEVPEWESEDTPEGFGDVAPGASDLEVAALAVAYLQDTEAKPLIEAQKPMTPMLEVALALFGDRGRLKAEHFDSSSANQDLQIAAVDAVVRSKGRDGLQMALSYQQASHWWEEEHVATKLSRMLQEELAPGSQMLADCKSLAVLKQWFDQHGGAFLSQAEK